MIGRSAYDRHLDPPEPPPSYTEGLEAAGILTDQDWEVIDAHEMWERLENALEWAAHIGGIEAKNAIAESAYIEAYYEDWERQAQQAEEYYQQRDEDDAIDLIMASETPAEEWRRR